MERYNFFGIIRVFIFSLISVIGLVIWLTRPPYSFGLYQCYFGIAVIILGVVGLIISLISWLDDLFKKKSKMRAQNQSDM